MNALRRALTIPREPDFTVGEGDTPYLRRWWVIPRNRRFNLYLHHFMRSDDDRALHDHPWWNVSILLRGRYIEHFPDGTRRVRRAGRVYGPRKATDAHRIELFRDPTTGQEIPVWTLFITGPVRRMWGFHCPNGWRHWREYVQQVPGGNKTGKGCGD